MDHFIENQKPITIIIHDQNTASLLLFNKTDNLHCIPKDAQPCVVGIKVRYYKSYKLPTMNGEIEKKLLEKSIDKAFAFVDEMVKPPLKEIGGLLGDQVKFWRYKNQVNIVLKSTRFP